MEAAIFTFTQNAREEKGFWGLAEQVYNGNPYWSPLSENYHKNILYTFETDPDVSVRGIIIEKNGRTLARAVTVYHRRSESAWLGLFEALEEQKEAVRQLFKTGVAILGAQGVNRFTAPRLDHQIIGLKIAGFDCPQNIMTPYNPPYYVPYFLDNGFSPKTKSLSLIVDKETLNLPDIKLPWVKIRAFNPEKLEREIGIFHQLQGEIFSDREDYIARTLEQDTALIQNLLPLLDLDLILIAEDLTGKPLGIIIALPDHYQTQMNRVRVLSIGIKSSFQAKGIGSMLVRALAIKIVEKGYSRAEVSWILAENQAPQTISNRLGARPGRQFCLYQKEIETYKGTESRPNFSLT